MESGHVRRPQAARSTGRPQYHGGRRGMRDKENVKDRKERRGRVGQRVEVEKQMKM